MSEDVLKNCAGLPEITLAPGEVLMEEGQRSPVMFVLISGTLSVWRGTTRITRVKAPGALLGEMSQLLDHPYSATVKAETEARLYRVEDGIGFLGSTSAVSLHAARLLAQRLHDATTYLADIKRQFEDQKSHLGMVDRVLGSLLYQEPSAAGRIEENPKDPRL